MCGDSSKCVHCTCVQSGVMCSSCLPLRHGHCSNLSLEIDCPGIGSRTSSHDNNGLNNVTDISNSVTTLFNERFQCAFGTSLLHSGGHCYDDPWCKLCLQLVTFRNCHYNLPNGSVDRDFVTWLPSQIGLLAQGFVHSERGWYLCISTTLQ